MRSGFKRNYRLFLVALITVFIVVFITTTLTAEVRLELIELPEGFSIELYAMVPGARSMVMSEGGILYVGTRADKIYAVIDKDGDHRAEEVVTVKRGLDTPNGVAFKNGDLYVAEVSRIIRFDNIDRDFRNNPGYEVVYDRYPTDRSHGWKYIAFGPDGLLYVPVGAPCNVCDPEDEIYSTITRIRDDGSDFQIYAKGIRNTVGFDWHPVTGELWFTDNGRDWLGDDLPADELNRVSAAGEHYGFPYCHQGNLSDDKYGEGHSCEDFTPPEINLGPHVAALGMKFYTGDQFPEEYKGNVFIAEHGSWNRSVPIGYRVTLVRLRNGSAVDYSVFASGWLDGVQSWGRPVDVLQLPDGSLLVSDDKAGAIYRISYDG